MALIFTAAAVIGSGCGGSGGDTVTSVKTVTKAPTGTQRKAPTDAQSTGSTQVAKNLVATPEIKHQLLLAWADPKVKGPLPGTTYLGQYGDIRYALATFDLPIVGTTDQPELLIQEPGKPWALVKEVGGDPPSDVRAIPCPLRKVWGFGCAEADTTAPTTAGGDSPAQQHCVEQWNASGMGGFPKQVAGVSSAPCRVVVVVFVQGSLSAVFPCPSSGVSFYFFGFGVPSDYVEKNHPE